MDIPEDVARREPVTLDELEEIRARAKVKVFEGCLCGRIPHLKQCPRFVLADRLEAYDEDTWTLIREVERLRAVAEEILKEWESQNGQAARRSVGVAEARAETIAEFRHMLP